MKYKSELLNEILEQRGHEVPNLHYQSECVETWIEENKGAYPKLCDYESEWLNYINENPIGEFPYETIATNSTATVNHVVPFEYKSAILKGQTLKEITNNLFDGEVEDGDYEIGTGEKRDYSNRKRCANKIEINPSTTYTLSGITWYLQYDENGDYLGYAGANDKRLVFTSKNNARYLTFYNLNNESDFFVGLGDTEPLYELVSVKMPVLTTYGKNLFNGELISGYYEDGSLSKIIGSTSNLYKTIRLNLKKGTYTFSFEESVKFIRQLKDGVYDTIDGDYTKFTTTLQTDGTYVLSFRKTDNSDFDLTKIQIEQGSTPSSYESYKSNILTVNEPVELRGIGEVKDELNLITGELTQRIGEIVLDGSENWGTLKQGRYCIENTLNNVNRPHLDNINFKCDKLKPISYSEEYSGTLGISLYTGTNYDFVVRTDIQAIEEFKQWLSNNPTTVQYLLATESIKTVDLTVVNQDGEPLSKIKPIEGTMHIEVSGTPINPTAVLEVPVEAITQNLNSFIEGE